MNFYHYLFYSFYIFSEAAPARFWSEWKAGLVLFCLQVWTLIALAIYIELIFGINLFPREQQSIIIITLVFLLNLKNWYLFYRGDRWKIIISHYNSQPKKKNRRLRLFVILLILAVISNLILAYYLLSKSH